MNSRRIILRDIGPEDFILASRAVQYLMGLFQKDAVVCYGADPRKCFYVCRNKSSITVRPT